MPRLDKDKADKNADSLVEALLASDQMDQDADYRRRGRNFEHVSLDDLATRWVIALRAFVAHCTIDVSQKLADLEAEFRLRGQPLPEDLVQPERAILRSKVKASDPNDPGVLAAIAAFLGRLKHPDG